jgi:hypothetical protein
LNLRSAWLAAGATSKEKSTRTAFFCCWNAKIAIYHMAAAKKAPFIPRFVGSLNHL